MSFITTNPSTGDVEYRCDEHTEAQVEDALANARAAFLLWRKTAFALRREYMNELARVLRSEKRVLAELMAREMGKPVTAGEAEIEKCAWVCEYYAVEAEGMIAPETVSGVGSKTTIRFEPLGVVLAVMPWNFPFWQVFRFAAPALMAGNVGLLKHASNVPQCSKAIERLFSSAGFAAGVFQNLLIGSSRVERVVADDRVAAVTLTGSEYAGSQVASAAGKAIKKSVLELGGSDPFIVFTDADLESAAQSAALARLQNCGQSCIAAKRFIVLEAVVGEFLEKMRNAFQAIRVGDPLDVATQMGPLSSRLMLEDVERQVRESVSRGARIVLGGERIERKGFYYEPTILADVAPGSPSYHEELFGPVAAVITAKDDEDAIRIANDSEFGLGASLWTADLVKAEQYAALIDAGCVFINDMVKSDPRMPFGGIKKSGFGRELSAYGLREFVNIKTVSIA